MAEREPAAKVAPTVRRIECFEVLCAGCGKDAFEEYEGIPHFTSTVEAVKDLAGWVWTDPERPVCPRCHVRALCAAHGHVWGSWHRAALMFLLSRVREDLDGGRPLTEQEQELLRDVTYWWESSPWQPKASSSAGDERV